MLKKGIDKYPHYIVDKDDKAVIYYETTNEETTITIVTIETMSIIIMLIMIKNLKFNLL
ncbi:hypothetical protein RIR_e18749_A0A2I1E4P2_9GLOM [Rhizophagus irregularis DAOM 181602=DAOM 197198]|nr:hypothetical protein RIR_e18749_A0A2I1E4P2_9GLOM [Rhizophagus irregularis DAOM 181602=DAOM 197198]